MRFETRTLPAATYTNGVRRHARTLFSVPITIDNLCKGEMRSSHGITLDISEGGLGALVQTMLQVGERVTIHLPLPKHYLTVLAVVRHTAKTRSGFEFIQLTPEERSHIATASAVSLPAIW